MNGVYQLLMFVLNCYLSSPALLRQAFYLTYIPIRRLAKATPAAWGYTQKNGPSSWSKLSESYALCVEGKRQSPIAIETASAVHSDKTYIKLEKLNSLMTGTLSNTGHSLEYKPNTDSPVPFVEASADFPGLEFCNPFRLAQFHFHWGSNDQEGSEHLVDGNRGCGEIHFVYANSKYENAKIAVKQPDGLIVVGYMLRVEEESALDYLFKFIPEISVSKDQVKNIPFQISQFFQEKSAHGSGGFYVYQGSLTTPPCHESVTWFLSPLQLGITREQLAVLRSQRVDEHTPLEHNFRPIQPLNGRKIIQIQCIEGSTECAGFARLKRLGNAIPMVSGHVMARYLKL